MSSAVSLVPTKKTAGRSRRPAFRPGGQRKGRPNGKNAKKPSGTVLQKRPNNDNNNNNKKNVASLNNTIPLVDAELEHDKSTLIESDVIPPEESQPVQEERAVDETSSLSAVATPTQDTASVQSGINQSQDGKAQEPSISAANVVTQEEEETQPEQDTSSNQATIQVRSSKRRKRKVSAGAAIATPRQTAAFDSVLEDTTSQPATTTTTTTKTTTESVPSAAPGEKTLKTFCSTYKAGKRQKKKDDDNQNQQESATAPPPPPPPENDKSATTAGPVVQIINGEIVLQESSMLVPNARKSVAEVEEEFQHVVEEEGNTTTVGASYNSFVSRRKPQHWTVEETKLFYKALRQVGIDFATMEVYFEKRTRKQLKRKYHTENTKNPHLIALALDPRAKVAIDLGVFNVDKDSIKVPTKTTESNKENETKGDFANVSAPSNEDRAAQETQPQESTVETPPAQEPEPSLFDVFAGEDEQERQQQQQEKAADPLDEFNQVEELVGGTEELGDDAPTAAIPLAPTQSKSRSKRPKFKAKRGRRR